MDEHATDRDWSEALPGIIGAGIVLAVLVATIVGLAIAVWSR